MLDIEKIQLALLEAKVLENFINEEVEVNELYQFLLLSGAVTYREKLDSLFTMLYNKFSDIPFSGDEEYLQNIFDAIVDIQEAQEAQEAQSLIEEFGGEIIEEKSNEDEIPNEIKPVEVLEARKQASKAYAQFLYFLNTDLDNQELEIKEKLQRILEIDHTRFPNKSETRKIYLYFLMNIALAQPIAHMDIIKLCSEELEKILNDVN